ncbi:hypothetical protein [Shewanella sp. FJAT-52076]|uniref:hypothetical protein n=1 Tax=Shewanella sp. FJAT-52076 TaxID=2864202 RepID=UPI001C66105A|nr:hypothetical protein [Shewanella sp. FJAT-52076]QYJ75521.1 hypothetical protein K0H79_00480 [Shewanella sp. FJAT-52076]
MTISMAPNSAVTQSMAPKFLFIPVSSAEGMGEYMRSLIVADEVKRCWPAAEVCFILSKEAPYAASCPYPTKLLDRTPTKEVKAVNDIMETFRPDVVLFDASGRKSQLARAHAQGAKVVFFSQHRRKRSRGMKIGRARVTDAHLVVQPEFVIGPVSAFEAFKLKLIGKPLPECIGPVFSAPDKARQQELLAQYGLAEGEFVLFNAGSGGHKLAGGLAADRFFEAAQASHAASGLKSVMVFGPNYPKTLPEASGVICLSALANSDFINLLVAAKAAVLSGGDTLLQAIALKKLVLTAPVSKDQPPRIAVCADRGLVLACEPEQLAANISALFSDETTASLQQALAAEADMDGLQLTMNKIKHLLEVQP